MWITNDKIVLTKQLPNKNVRFLPVILIMKKNLPPLHIGWFYYIVGWDLATFHHWLIFLFFNSRSRPKVRICKEKIGDHQQHLNVQWKVTLKLIVITIITIFIIMTIFILIWTYLQCWRGCQYHSCRPLLQLWSGLFLLDGPGNLDYHWSLIVLMIINWALFEYMYILRNFSYIANLLFKIDVGRRIINNHGHLDNESSDIMMVMLW